MAFFEDLSNKLEDIGHTVYQKGQETAEIAKLKVKIAEIKCSNDKLYKEIGSFYVNYPGSPEDIEYLSYMEGRTIIIKHNLREIASLKRKIRNLKNVTLCECGAEVSNKASFCPSCGKHLHGFSSFDLIDDDEELPF